MNNIDITELAQRLREAAEKASRGIWRGSMTRFNGIINNEITAILFNSEPEAIIASTVEKRDAEFIALANPVNILLILDALESAQERIAELESPQLANWDGREFETTAGWINELLCLADHSDKIPNRARDAMRVIANGLRETLSQSVVANAIPMQPIIIDKHGTPRFKVNAIVETLLEVARNVGYDLNAIAIDEYSNDDRMQLAQLMGYSVSGYGSLSYVSDESYSRALSSAPALQEGE